MIYRLYALAAGVLAVLILLWALYGAGYRNGRQETERRMAAAVAEANEKTYRAERAANRRSQEIEYATQAKLAEMDRRYRDAVGRIGAVRVSSCPTGRGGLSAVSGPPSGHSAATGGDGLPGTAGPDIGPALIEFARLADMQTRQLLACQDWIRGELRARQPAGPRPPLLPSGHPSGP